MTGYADLLQACHIRFACSWSKQVKREQRFSKISSIACTIAASIWSAATGRSTPNLSYIQMKTDLEGQKRC